MYISNANTYQYDNKLRPITPVSMLTYVVKYETGTTRIKRNSLCKTFQKDRIYVTIRMYIQLVLPTAVSPPRKG